MKSIKYGLFALSTLILGCSTPNEARVEGQFFGHGGKQMLIEKVTPGATQQIVDTVTSDENGMFNFAISFEDNNPLFINIRNGNSYVPLLLEPGQIVKVSSIGNVYNNYEVSGSDGSMKLQELNMSTVNQMRKLDSIARLFTENTPQTRAQELTREYGRLYIDLKRNIIRFVVTNPSSMASIVPLYQPITGGRYIFDEPTDIIYFRTVADSLAKYYPTSPYVVSLRADLQQGQEQLSKDSVLRAKLSQEINEVSLPTISLKDAEGQTRELSEVLGKGVVLLDFTSLLPAEMKIRNREIAEIYESYKDKDFEIFQVSLDDNRAAWLRAVVEGRYGWVSVNASEDIDIARMMSSYNITTLPTSFIIDEEQNIVARDIATRKELEAALKKVL